MSSKTLVTLDNGVQMPQIGLGTWRSKPNEVRDAVAHALKHGYRHLDLAKIYQNQDEVAAGIKLSGIPRSEIFITGKLWNTYHKPDMVLQGLEDTLRELETDYLDLFLIHWPLAFEPVVKSDGTLDMSVLKPMVDDTICVDLKTTLADTWKAMIQLKETGKVRAVGVSNCTQQHLEALIAATGVKPSVNQIERHPLLPQTELLKYCADNGIHVTAYSPLGNNILGERKIVDYPEVKEIADRLSADPAQVLIAWAKRGGVSLVPKSVTPSRIESNFKEIEISDSDYEAISNIGKGKEVRYNVPVTYASSWLVNVFETEIEQSAPYKVNVV
ncbi:NADP-dependent oxidoreductase domain-containing protein [Melampsora americana]|nr:NADP-dependent oxidoreductase domain-containing protein [Melampsora americana]